MPQTPNMIVTKTNTVITAWSTLAPNATFAGLTLAEFKARVQPVFDRREELVKLREQMTALLVQRAAADTAARAVAQQVVKAVVGDVTYDDDSPLYEAMDYIRKSDRKSGLTRKRKAVPPAA